MTREQKILAAWAGAGLLALIAAWVWISGRGEGLGALRATADRRHARYVELYETGPGAVPAAQGVARAAELAERQERELATVKAALVPELPPQYRPSSLNDASAQVTRDYSRIKSTAQSRGVKLQQSLPFEGGLEGDNDKRALQLAQLFVVARVLDMAIENGVAEITQVAVDKAQGHFRDPSGAYAVLICDVTCFCTYQASEHLLQGLLAHHGQGLGVRAVDLEQQSEKDLQQLRLSVSLLTAYNPAWDLPEEGKAGGRPGTKTATKPQYLGGG